MTYYPKSQIKENQYTNGGEYLISSTQENYKGYYWSTSKKEYFTGKTPKDKPTQKLEIASKLIGLEKTNLSTPTIEPFPSNYYIVDNSYYKSKNLPTKRDAPRPPIQTLNVPTNKDIQNGFFYRYFVKKGNEFKFIEISKEEYNLFQNQDISVQWQLYTPIKIQWGIQGNRKQVYNGNKTVVSLTEQRENTPGFTLSFKKQFDKFWLSE
jgi:hypothetical protein